MNRHQKGFTLIEMVVAVGIVAILSIVALILISPAQLLAQGRDSNRLSGMLSLNGAVTLFTQNVRGGFIGTSSIVYVSIPDPSATSTAGDQCQGLSLPTLPTTLAYHCAASTTVKAVDGTGWVPVALNGIGGGSPISILPIDPTNTSSTGLFYTYTTDGVNYEFTAAMESAKYKLGGSSDAVSTDGGTKASLYETGTSFALEPLDYGDNSLVGYWPFTEGTGTVAYDYSGNNATGSVSSVANWGPGMSGGYALQPNDNGTGALVGAGNFYPTTGFTVSVWVNSTDTDGGSSRVIGFAGSPSTWWLNFGNGYPYINAIDSSGHALVVASSSATNVATGQWNQLAATFSPSAGGILYLDGIAVSSKTYGAFTGNLGIPEPVDFGYQFGQSGVGLSLNGLMNNVRIYNRALSATEIQSIYKAQD